jgi:hypothetical protein
MAEALWTTFTDSACRINRLRVIVPERVKFALGFFEATTTGGEMSENRVRRIRAPASFANTNPSAPTGTA